MSLISGENIMLVWATVLGIALLSVRCEKANPKVPGFIIAILIALGMVSLKITPTSSQVYRVIKLYIMPMSLPMFFFKADIKKIIKESGRLFITFHLAAIGTIIGTLIAVFLLGNFIDSSNIQGIVAMYTAAGIGGTINMAAMADIFNVPESLTSVYMVSGNLSLVILIFTITTISKSKFMRKLYKHPHIKAAELSDNVEIESNNKTIEKSKAISKYSIAQCLAISAIILAISLEISNVVKTLGLPEPIKIILGNKYLLITFITVVLATVFPKYFSKINGSSEIGLFMLILYFVAIGSGSTIMNVITKAPVFLVMGIIIIFINLVFTLIASKFFKFNLEESLLCSAACYGGTGTSVAVSTGNRWNSLIAPGLLVAVYGYIIGNYVALAVASFF